MSKIRNPKYFSKKDLQKVTCDENALNSKKKLKNNFLSLIMAMFSNDFQPKSSSKFYCNYCYYNTSKKSNYEEHLLTLKHKKSMIGNDNSSNSSYLKPNIIYMFFNYI
jgi:hypothetical protein